MRTQHQEYAQYKMDTLLTSFPKEANMYSVVYYDADRNGSLKVYLFRSAVERECWDFIRRRQSHNSVHVKRNALNLFVVDGADQFCDTPEDVAAMRKYLRAS